tara:strand:+ start:38466 stop:38582 length:117 start_codon:yes stop_codon:yes gene_type:complete
MFFNPKKNLGLKLTDKIMETVNKCPSGALSYYKNKKND